MRDSVAVKQSAEPDGKAAVDEVVRSFIRSIDSAEPAEQPPVHGVPRAEPIDVIVVVDHVAGP